MRGGKGQKPKSPASGNVSCQWRGVILAIVLVWAQNWRKGGLQNRRNELLKEFGFYNQLYCGCEFSMRGLEQQKQQHDAGRSEQDTVKTV